MHSENFTACSRVVAVLLPPPVPVLATDSGLDVLTAVATFLLPSLLPVAVLAGASVPPPLPVLVAAGAVDQPALITLIRATMARAASGRRGLCMVPPRM
jgi:hypothetical protein